MPNPKLIGAIGILLVLAFLTTQMLSFRALYHTEKADFKSYKTQREADDKIAAVKNKATEENWKKLFSESEVRHAHDLEISRARFAAELVRVRQRAISAANSPLPDNAATIAVCADAPGNQRLSDAFSIFRKDILGLLGACQDQAITLISCQTDLRALTTQPTP